MSYPLDLNATLATNYETTVKQRDAVGDRWFFVLPGGVFYTKDLIVKNTLNNQQLEPNTQFRALHLNKKATIDSGGKETATIIVIIDAVVAEVEIKHRVVGGEFETIGTDLDEIITDEDLADLSATAWGQVLGEPYQYPFDPHMHYDDEIYGLEHVIYLLNSIADGVTMGDGGAFGMFYQYIDKQIAELNQTIDGRIEQVTQRLDSIDENRKLKPGAIVIFTNNTNPAVAYQYGTWQRLNNTMLYGVTNDANLGEIKKVGEGVDYLMSGVYFWELISQ